MPKRVGEPQQIGGSERVPTWLITLSEEPSADWRRRFLQYAHAGGIFSGAQMKVETAGLVFALERSALRLACEHIDQWIVQANDEMSRLTGQSRAQVPEPRSRTILVVDDDATIGPWVQAALEPLGYVVLKTVDPLEAIRMGRDRPGEIDLLLVDVIMPLMDGRKLAQRLRALRPKLKVLLMSGYELSGLEESGWPFIAKPFSMEELAHTVATTLGEEAPPPLRRPSPFD